MGRAYRRRPRPPGAPSGLRRRLLGVAALEALHAAAGVDQLLLARVERVAVRADLHAELGLRGAGGERVAARAVDRGGHVLGVDALLHLASPFMSGGRSRRAGRRPSLLSYSTTTYSRPAIELRNQPGRRHHPVRVLHDLADLLPVHRDVEIHPEPAAMSHVRRAEEPLRV